MGAQLAYWSWGLSEKYGSRSKRRELIPSYCEICGYDKIAPTKHRIKPGRLGGKYIPGNVIGLCRNCHQEAEDGLILLDVQLKIIQERLKLSLALSETAGKICRCCGELKLLEDFQARTDSSDGYRNECRACKSDYMRQYTQRRRGEIVAHIGTKQCAICGHKKPLQAFAVHHLAQKGRRPECNECRNEQRREAYRSDPELLKQAASDWRNAQPHNKKYELNRKSALKQRYGLTLDDYERLLVDQNGTCAICQECPTGKPLAVDHTHRRNIDGDEMPCTKEDVRGLLCERCNTAIGFLKDDVQRLAAAIKYLEKSKWQTN